MNLEIKVKLSENYFFSSQNFVSVKKYIIFLLEKKCLQILVD